MGRVLTQVDPDNTRFTKELSLTCQDPIPRFRNDVFLRLDQIPRCK